MASLSLKNVSKVFPNGFVAVKDFSMEIEDGEFIILAGPSGCGKSTTLRMIAGLEDVSSGEIRIGQTLVNDIETQEREVAMIFQNYILYPNMTAYENMAFGLKMKNMSKDTIDAAVQNAAQILDLEDVLARKPRSLSGSQQQRVALGRAIVRSPKVLLMDEPLSNLDEKLRVQMRKELKEIQQRLNATIVYVTHDQTEAMTLGSRIVIMNDGVVQQIGTPEELYEKPVNKFVAGFMGSPQMNFFDVTVEQEGNTACLCFEGRRILLDEKKGAALLKAGYAGKMAVCGIRPEDIHTDEAFMASTTSNIVEATVQVYEMLGAEAFLHFQVSGCSFITRVSPKDTARPGDVIKVCLDVSKLHVFDKATETAITN